MKRKMVIVMLIISAIVLPLTAKSAGTNPNYIGGSFGGDFNFQKIKDSDSDSTRITGITFGVEGANFFGKQGNIGVGYSLGGIATTAVTIGNTTRDVSDYPVKLDVTAEFLYRYPVSKEFSVAAGLGAGYGFRKNNETTVGQSIKITHTTNTVSLFGDVKLMYNVVDSVKLFGGVKLGGAVYMKYRTKFNDESTDTDTSYSEFRVTPYIGVGYAY